MEYLKYLITKVLEILIFLSFLNLANEKFQIISKLKIIIIKFTKDKSLFNQNIKGIIENRYIKKLLKYSFSLIQIISNAIRSYFKVWAETFKLNKNSSSKEFSEFIISDLIFIYLFSLDWGMFSFILYNSMALFPRIFLLARRLKARNLSTNLSFLIFFPIFGWFITWKMGIRNDLVTNIENKEKNTTKQSNAINFTNFLLSILVIAFITFGTTYFINQNKAPKRFKCESKFDTYSRSWIEKCKSY